MLVTFWLQPYVLLNSELQLVKMQIREVFGTEPSIKNFQGCFSTELPMVECDKKIRRIAFIKKCSFDENYQNIETIPDSAFFEILTHVDRRTTFQGVKNNIIFNCKKIKESHYLTHGLHDYKGKFYPQIVRSLLFSANLQKNAKILDPFCGSGTTLVEASLMGLDSVGIDINPLACFMAQTKVDALKMNGAEFEDLWPVIQYRILVRYQSLINASDSESNFHKILIEANVDRIPNLDKWYSKKILLKLLSIKTVLTEVEDPNQRNLLLLCLSDIIKPVSNWAPGQARVRMRKIPLGDVDVFTLFNKKVNDAINVLQTKSFLTKHLDINLGSSVVKEKSITEIDLDEDVFDGVVTSPPYANALPYIDTLRLPATFLGLTNWKEMKQLLRSEIGNREINKKIRNQLLEDFSSNPSEYDLPPELKNKLSILTNENSKLPEINFRRKDMPAILLKYFLDMDKAVANISRSLKFGGKAMVVIGNNYARAGDIWLEIDTHRYLSEMFNKYGCSHLYTIDKEMAHTSSPRKIDNEHIMVLEKRSKLTCI